MHHPMKSDESIKRITTAFYALPSDTRREIALSGNGLDELVEIIRTELKTARNAALDQGAAVAANLLAADPEIEAEIMASVEELHE